MVEKQGTNDETIDDSQVFDDLERESKEFDKDAEIDRIMHAFKLNAYEVLDLLPGVPDSDIRICYRKKSLLIHPDKTKNPQAPDAFDRLKKAEGDLMDEKRRAQLDEAISDARRLVIRDQKWTIDSEELKGEWFLKNLWPEKIRRVIVDEELRRQKQQRAQLREEGRQQRKEDEEITERKRKREAEQKWEDTRDSRINSWRDFQKGGKASAGGESGIAVSGGGGGGTKKKKQKTKPLG